MPQTTLSSAKIVFVVRLSGDKYLRWRDEDSWSYVDFEDAEVWPYEKRDAVINQAANLHGTAEAWVSRDGKLTMQIPLEAVC